MKFRVLCSNQRAIAARQPGRLGSSSTSVWHCSRWLSHCTIHVVVHVNSAPWNCILPAPVWGKLISGYSRGEWRRAVSSMTLRQRRGWAWVNSFYGLLRVWDVLALKEKWLQSKFKSKLCVEKNVTGSLNINYRKFEFFHLLDSPFIHQSHS